MNESERKVLEKMIANLELATQIVLIEDRKLLEELGKQ